MSAAASSTTILTATSSLLGSYTKLSFVTESNARNATINIPPTIDEGVSEFSHEERTEVARNLGLEEVSGDDNDLPCTASE